MGDNERCAVSTDDDAPLDFSIKRTSPGSSEESSDDNERPGVLRSPELGQTAVQKTGFSSSDKQVITIKPDAEKIGEPQAALPGLLPGGTGSTAALPAYPPAGLLPNLAAMQGLLSGSTLPVVGSSVESNSPSQQGQQSKNNGKGNARPFKAYPKDPLSLPLGYFGLPGMNPFPGLDGLSANQTAKNEEMFKQYREYVIKMQEQQQQLQKTSGGVPLDKSPPLQKDPTIVKLPSSPTSVSSTSSLNGDSTPTSPSATQASPASCSSNTVSTTTNSNNKRKRLATMPDEQKDAAYWERRRKNNDAAKRSRDARRAKEDEIAIRAALLEQENLRLRVEITSLKNETAKLRCMLYNS